MCIIHQQGEGEADEVGVLVGLENREEEVFNGT